MQRNAILAHIKDNVVQIAIIVFVLSPIVGYYSWITVSLTQQHPTDGVADVPARQHYGKHKST